MEQTKDTQSLEEVTYYRLQKAGNKIINQVILSLLFNKKKHINTYG